MTFEFKNKSPEQIAAEINDINAGAGQVDEAFKALKELAAPARKSAVDAFEKLLIKETAEVSKGVLNMLREVGMSLDEVLATMPNANETRESIKEEFPDLDIEKELKELKEQPTEDLSGEDEAWAELAESMFEMLAQPPEEVAAGIANAQACCQMFNNVAKAKGKAADPIIKAIVKEISTLTNADKQDEDKMMFTMVKGYQKATKQGPKL